MWKTFVKHGVTAPAEDDPMIIEFCKRFATLATGYGVPPAQVCPRASGRPKSGRCPAT